MQQSLHTTPPQNRFANGFSRELAVDAPLGERPGVPMETPSPSLARGSIALQRGDIQVSKRMELEQLTPVYGTAQPPRGVSGALRTLAYSIPEHKARHWALLMLADRIDVIEHGRPRIPPVLYVIVPAAALFFFFRAVRA